MDFFKTAPMRLLLLVTGVWLVHVLPDPNASCC